MITGFFMKQYFEVIFEPVDTIESDILIARLDDLGFYAYESTGNILKAYTEDPVDEAEIQKLAGEKHRFRIETIPEINWNAQWEASMQPIVVEDFVSIRAGFHTRIEYVKYDILITPKMSFGTGHHDTTQLMICQMKGLDYAGKTVIDFGTGTGVLAILASKMGARNTFAIDNDPWSIDNANENIVRNNCNNISVMHSSNLDNVENADIILANINLRVLLDQTDRLIERLKPMGYLVLSGILENDGPKLCNNFLKKKCMLINEKKQNNWVSLLFQNSGAE